ncbi:hypothetical protein NE236_21340 [Actinoallomurus purpureus]|uniref:hypothetical protein n=1 Tax=Actinoallomurus purpureus TaxID=478114 RepID=UPI002091F922|nr:hypothetical protein [Actinoallomurus purpureus]MCO6007527.1 hypothetical protein [Actinoallomurus purpureus]
MERTRHARVRSRFERDHGDKGGQLAEHGRGMSIVDHLAVARWVTYVEHAKTVHVVIAAPDVTLTAAELAQIGVPE